jgi:DNA-binding IclR family transcriptional regulator
VAAKGPDIAGTGVGTLNKCVAILVAVRSGAASVADVARATGLPRGTAHRLVAGLEGHGLLRRSNGSVLSIGPLAAILAAQHAAEVMVACAPPFLEHLRDSAAETAQLFVRRGHTRVCAAAAAGTGRLRDSIGVGDILPLGAGSAAQVLLAWEPAAEGSLPHDARFGTAELAAVRRLGWAQSVGQRDSGLASVSAPVRHRGMVLGAVCVGGPVQRLGDHPGDRLAPLVLEAAQQLGERMAIVTGADGAKPCQGDRPGTA